MKKVLTVFMIILIAFGISLIKNILFLNFIKLERIEFELDDSDIDDFGYWINDIDKDDIKNSKYDLIIIDYSSDGSEEEEFTRNDVEDMKSSGDKEKLLISYISIGEAEDYRFYWQESWDANQDGIPDTSAPDWLDIENPDWEGNYKVKFWIKGWQDIIYNYLDRIMSVDFDGIYMDIIDAYEYYEDDLLHSDWLMIDFVVNITNYVKAVEGSDFLIFVQNGDDLLSNSTYLDHIDGIGREDLFYNDDDETDEDWRDDAIENLNEALEDDKAVLIIDYPTLEIYEFYKLCIDNGYLPYVAERDLDCLKYYSLYSAT